MPSRLPKVYAPQTLATKIIKYAISMFIKFSIIQILYRKSEQKSRTIFEYLKIILDTWFSICYNNSMKLYRTGRWSTKERQYLKDHYNKIPMAELASKLMRTNSSITSQVNYLRKRGWAFHRRKDESN